MGRRKRSSVIWEKAVKRVASLETISPELDLGNGLTLAMFSERTGNLGKKMEAHNKLVSALDASGVELDNDEKEMSDLTERMLAGVAARFGKDSTEYELAGGVRKSERKHSSRKPDPAGAKG